MIVRNHLELKTESPGTPTAFKIDIKKSPVRTIYAHKTPKHFINVQRATKNKPHAPKSFPEIY